MDAFVERLLATDHWALFGRWPLLIGFAAVAAQTGSRVGFHKTLMATAALFTGLAVGTFALPSVIGAALGAAAGWTLTLRWMGERRSTAVPLALWMLGVVAVGRLGCFLAGCCFGTPTDLPFGVSYGLNTPALYTHQHMGWVQRHASHSLPVHPIQLYEAAFVASLLVVTYAMRRRVRSGLALTLAVGAAYLCFRVVVDPLRAMVNTWSSLQYCGPLTVFQCSAFAGSAVLFWGAYRFNRVSSPQPAGEGWHPGPLWLALAVTGFCGRHAVPPLFYGLMVLSLTAAAIALAWQSVRRSFRGHGAVSRGAAAVVGAVLLLPMWLHGRGDIDRAVVDPREPARRWLYGVDRATGRLVRVGHQETQQQQLWQRSVRLFAGGPAAVTLPSEVTPALVLAPRRPNIWLTGSLAGSSLRYRYDDVAPGQSCGGDASPTVVETGELATLGVMAGLRVEDFRVAPAAMKAPIIIEAWGGVVGAKQRAEVEEFNAEEPTASGERSTFGVELGTWAQVNLAYGGAGVGLALGLVHRGAGPLGVSRLHWSAMPMLYTYAGYEVAFVELGLNTPWLRTVPAGAQAIDLVHAGARLEFHGVVASAGLRHSLRGDNLRRLGVGVLAREAGFAAPLEMAPQTAFYLRLEWMATAPCYRAGVTLTGAGSDDFSGLLTLSVPMD